MNCPSCKTLKTTSHYLCRTCWFTLTLAARRALNRRYARASLRLLELHRQIRRDVPLAEVVITP